MTHESLLLATGTRLGDNWKSSNSDSLGCQSSRPLPFSRDSQAFQTEAPPAPKWLQVAKNPIQITPGESWGPRFTYVYLTKFIIKSFHRTHWDKTMVSTLRVVQKTSCSLKPKSGPKAKPEVLEVLPWEVELIMLLRCLLSPSHLLLFPMSRHRPHVRD